MRHTLLSALLLASIVGCEPSPVSESSLTQFFEQELRVGNPYPKIIPRGTMPSMMEETTETTKFRHYDPRGGQPSWVFVTVDRQTGIILGIWKQ